MQDNLTDCFERVLAELSTILIQNTKAPEAIDAGRASQEPAARSRAALEAYLHEMRKSEAQSTPGTTARTPKRRAA